jgi:hypothetical protein
VAQGQSVHFKPLHRIGSDRSKMSLSEEWSSAIGLTDSTVTVVVEMMLLASGFLILQLSTSPSDRSPAGKLTFGDQSVGRQVHLGWWGYTFSLTLNR